MGRPAAARIPRCGRRRRRRCWSCLECTEGKSSSSWFSPCMNNHPSRCLNDQPAKNNNKVFGIKCDELLHWHISSNTLLVSWGLKVASSSGLGFTAEDDDEDGEEMQKTRKSRKKGVDLAIEMIWLWEEIVPEWSQEMRKGLINNKWRPEHVVVDALTRALVLISCVPHYCEPDVSAWLETVNRETSICVYINIRGMIMWSYDYKVDFSKKDMGFYLMSDIKIN